MRKHLILAAVSAAALIPSLAMAQQTCEERSAQRKAGTAIGALAGAVLGSSVAAHGHKGSGAVVGGIAGAIVGNQVSKGEKNCQHAYGWYDNNGHWHANAVDRTAASGYYDRKGVWVDGEPHGYYDRNSVWVSGPDGPRATDTAYEQHDDRRDLDARIARLDARIDRDRDDGRLSHREARDARNTLNDIRFDKQDKQRYGRLSERDEAVLSERLDRLAAQVRYSD